MSENNGRERRQDPRLGLRTFARLSLCDTEWSVHLLDISHTGAKIALLDEYLLELGDVIHLTIDTTSLALTFKFLCLEGKVVHLREHIIGLKFNLLEEEVKQGLDALLGCAGEVVP